MSTDKPTTLIAALLLSCVGVFAIMAGPIMTEVLVAALGLPADAAGQIFAVEALGTALAPLAATLWMGRVKWRNAAIFALLVVVAGNIVSSYQTTAGALTALRFAIGFLGQGTAFTLAIGIISGSAQKDRNFAFLIAAQVVLGVLCFLVLPFPKDAGVGGVLLPLAGLALLTLATVGWIPQPSAAGAGHQAAGGGGSAGPAFIALAVMLIWCTGLGAIWAFVKLIGSSGGIDPAQVGLALGISTGVATLGALAASWLGDRIGRIIPVTVALLVQVVMIFLLQGQMGFLQFAITAAVFQIFWNLTGPYLMGTIALSDNTGKVSLLIPTAQIGGFFLGPVIAGQFLTGQGFGPANTVAIVCCLLALALFIPTAMRLKKRLAAG
ncbi:MAG: MFS transporter [Gammaproteobacteria bacterium]|nr:MFS transporter [Gammaproteobacteria bacterium]